MNLNPAIETNHTNIQMQDDSNLENPVEPTTTTPTPTLTPPTTIRASNNIDLLESHSGLRGLCALWVCLYHNVRYGSYGDKLVLNGGVAMPIFFMLSGYSLSVTYGTKDNFGAMPFYRNRIAKIYPIYILTLLITLPLQFTDFAIFPSFGDYTTMQFAIKVILNFLFMNIWVYPLPVSSSINLPSWFISVLWFQYMIFPITMRYYKRIKRKRIALRIHIIATVVISTYLFRYYDYVAATKTILTPGFFLFHIGILSGILCCEEMNGGNQRRWYLFADVSTFLLMAWLCISTFLKAMFDLDYKSNFIIQVYGTPLIILMVTSLSLDIDGESHIAKIYRLDVSKSLGRISMCLYLVHLPLLQYFCLILDKIAPDLLTLTDYDPLLNGKSMPWWGAFIMIPLSICGAFGLERYVESPCRRLLHSSAKTFGDSRSMYQVGANGDGSSLHEPLLDNDVT